MEKRETGGLHPGSAARAVPGDEPVLSNPGEGLGLSGAAGGATVTGTVCWGNKLLLVAQTNPANSPIVNSGDIGKLLNLGNGSPTDQGSEITGISGMTLGDVDDNGAFILKHIFDEPGNEAGINAKWVVSIANFQESG